jgi:hypothetical protein
VIVIKFRRFISLILILTVCLSGPALLYVWDNILYPYLGMTKVVVAINEIPRGALIERNMLNIISIDKKTVVSGVYEVSKIDSLIGRETNRIVAPNEQITKYMLVEDLDVNPLKNEVIFPISERWIEKMPNSLLRGDKINLIPYFEFNDNESLIEDKPPIEGILVVFAKNNSNVEIETKDKERKVLTGKAKDLEVKVTKELADEIITLVKVGYKFVITYN